MDLRLNLVGILGIMSLSACQSSFKFADDGQLRPVDEVVDADNDGFPADEDCDDEDGSIFPGADEVCDGVDNNCDEQIDEEGAVDGDTWYADGDDDGFGDDEATTTACEEPSGYTDVAGDCDDADADIHPDALEICDGVDNDCDELIDDADDSVDLSTVATWYADVDGDGYGDASVSVESCDAPPGYVSDDTDCDDTEEDAYPGNTEVCDGVDNDCDELVDSSDPDVDPDETTTWYEDGDGDGYGDPDSTTDSCDPPAGHVLNDDDCDDGDDEINPEADELCDNVDHDCDGDDEAGAIDADTWYADVDDDGYGDGTSTAIACDEPSGYTDTTGDCDDTDADINPDGTETCAGADDEDCDGTVDEDGASDAETFYADSDGDGYGDNASPYDACSQPTGYVSDNTDCDDSESAINPDETEICDGIDNDCDTLIDSLDPDVDTSTQTDWYVDADGDGYGADTVSVSACDQPSGYVNNGDDCNDDDADINPDADEVCDNVDNDCDSLTDADDAGLTDGETWYGDSDGDGFGDENEAGTYGCADDHAGDVTDNTDCNDGDIDINPDATEVCDGVDNDCDGDVDDDDSSLDSSGGGAWYTDADGDGFGDDATEQITCTQPSGTVATGGDCDDTDTGINPDATEVCDGVDNDCDGTTDPDIIALYFDGTADGKARFELNNPALDMGTAGTVEMWVYADSGVDGYVLHKSDGNESKDIVVSAVDGVSSVMNASGSTTHDLAESSATVFSTGKWVHLAVSWDTTSARLYIDGALVDTDTSVGDVDDGNKHLRIGGGNSSSYPSFAGFIADVRLSDSALYTADFTPDGDLDVLSSTQALWKVEDGQADTGDDTLYEEVTGGDGDGNGLGADVKELNSNTSWDTVECRPE